ncbi:MAG: selenide, water dikinase SelD, partial [Actinomycetota bacterium]
DDAYDWGRIAATNALSDVYAMGGVPLLALNVVNWPADDLPLDLLGRVLQGGVDVATAAGVPVLGGHTITDPEPKYGMVAIGLAEEQHLVRNDAAIAGATLFLTKPLGVGIVSTAIKRGVATAAQEAAAIGVMTTLNAEAAAAARDAGVRAGTDVTGFGLLGHLHAMLLASGVAARLRAEAIPVLDGVEDLARAGVTPGGAGRNLAFVEPHLVAPDLDATGALVLADPQTSGGLLVAAADAARFRAAAVRRGVPAHEIGVVEPGPAGRIVVDGGR